MNIKPYEEPLMQYDEYRAHKILLLYVPPLLLVLGTFGNILSFCVLMRKAMRRTSTYNYLAVLSLTDMLVLYVGLLRLWVAQLVGYDLRDYSDWTCKIITMVGYTVSVYSVWLLIAVTVERYIVVVHSLLAPRMCTQSRAIKTIFAILFILLLINSHFLKTTQIMYYEDELDANTTIPICDAGEGFETLVTRVWPWVDACLYCLLPFILIFILNILIIMKVILARSTRESMSSSRSGVSHRSGESSAKVTIMLLTISFTFLITTLPMNVTLITTALWDSHATTLEEASKFKLARTISELLMYTNHSINFYLYLLTGHKFRQQLVKIFCCRKRTNWQSGFYTQVTHTDHTTNGKEGATELIVMNNDSHMDDKRL